MRVIKFRAWDKADKKMYPRVGISLYGIQCYKDNDNFPEQLIIDRGQNCFEIMQYTGIRDRHGKDIYEGDIVRRYINSRGNLYPSNYRKNIVIIEFKNAAWTIRKQTDRYEIIGNIHENPELLEVTKQP